MKERKRTMSRFNSVPRQGLYRSRNGVILGVCRGLADYFDFSAFWMRAIAVILFILYRFLAGGRHIFTGRSFDEIGAGEVCRNRIESQGQQPISLHAK